MVSDCFIGNQLTPPIAKSLAAISAGLSPLNLSV